MCVVASVNLRKKPIPALSAEMGILAMVINMDPV